MKFSKFVALFAVCVSLATGAHAQVNSELADYTSEIEAMRTVMQTERKILVMQEMVMTSDEAAAFWPLYDEYTAARKTVSNLRVKVITDYAAAYGSMTDVVAKQLLDDSIKYDDQMQKLRKKYIKKFRKILPEVKVTRYFQLEGKLDAIIDFDLASQVPLME